MIQKLLNFCFFVLFFQNTILCQTHFQEHNFDRDTIKERFKKLNQKTLIELYYNEQVEKKIIQPKFVNMKKTSNYAAYFNFNL